jgi:hypothetical protein
MFTSEYDDLKYQRISRACAPIPDLKLLTDGDEILIGDNGIKLSGVQ